MTRHTLYVDFAGGPDENGTVACKQGMSLERLRPDQIRAAIARGETVEEWIRDKGATSHVRSLHNPVPVRDRVPPRHRPRLDD